MSKPLKRKPPTKTATGRRYKTCEKKHPKLKGVFCIVRNHTAVEKHTAWVPQKDRPTAYRKVTWR